jgi:hypothetical protein
LIRTFDYRFVRDVRPREHPVLQTFDFSVVKLDSRTDALDFVVEGKDGCVSQEARAPGVVQI